MSFELFLSIQAAYFDRDDVALPGFAKFYKDSANEENEHAQKLIKYQNMRGGRVVLMPLNRPAAQEWATPLASIEFALALEKQVIIFRKWDYLPVHVRHCHINL